MAASTNRIAGIDFSTDEETRMILDSLNEFVEKEVTPVEEDLGERYTDPRLRYREDGRLSEDIVEAIETIRKKSAEAGFYAMNMPVEYGGEGVSKVTWYRALKEVPALGPGLSTHVLAGPEGPKPLLLNAEGEQVEKYLEPTIRGDKSTAFAQTEPTVGSDSPNMQTTASKDGDEWVLNGRKQWITNAPYADFAQVFARTTPQEEAGRYGGITCFIVESDEYEVGSMNQAVGMKGMQAELVFDDVRIPESRVLGDVDQAFYDAMEFLSHGRLDAAAIAIGQMETLLDAAKAYSNEREAFGKPIGKFQGVSHQIARGRAKAYVADAAGLRCAWKIERGENAIEDTSILKWFAADAYWDVADTTVQVHGGNGLSEDNEFMDHMKLARIIRIVEGTDEIQLNTIAKQLGL